MLATRIAGSVVVLLVTACGEEAGSGSMGGMGGASSAAGAGGVSVSTGGNSTSAGNGASAGSGAAAASAGGGGGDTATGPGGTGSEMGGSTAAGAGGTGAGGATGGTAGSTSTDGGGTAATGGGGAGAGEQCGDVCEAMGGLSFPKALCEDAGAADADAYFCSIETDEGCELHCAMALADAPTEYCRMQLSSLMACIAVVGDYEVLVTSEPYFGICESSLSETATACWGG